MTAPAGGDRPARIGRFTVSAVLGSGSFGTVYLGRDPILGLTVAVKVFDRDRSDDKAFAAALRSEADAMRRINDRHCVRVIDVVDEPDITAIVTELIDGGSLRAVLTRAGRLTGPQSLDVMRGALLGLTAVHDAGLVHGDIKPDNVLVDRKGVSRLIDFGLARDQGTRSVDGTVAGSPAYMSPEQIKGNNVDARSDIYACAAVLFELLTGRHPYISKRVIDVARMHLTATVPDPRDFAPTLAPDLAQLCMKGMAKRPDDRYATAADFLSALEQAALRRYGPAWRAGLGLGTLAGAAAAAIITDAVAANPAPPHTAAAPPRTASNHPSVHSNHPRTTTAQRISHLSRRARLGGSAAIATTVATGVILVIAARTPTQQRATAQPIAVPIDAASTSPATPSGRGSSASGPTTGSTSFPTAIPETTPTAGGPTARPTNSVPAAPPTTNNGRFTSPTLTITARSLGDVQIGMSFAKAQSAAGITFDGKGDGATYPTTLPKGFLHLFVDGNPVTCVGAEPGNSLPQRQTVSTPEGVRLGDSTKELLRIYGTRAHYMPAPAFGLNVRAGYIVRTADGNLGFGLDRARTTIIEISGSGPNANPINCTG